MGQLEIRNEKDQRLKEVVSALFATGYVAQQGVVIGGFALSQRLPLKRSATDIDLNDLISDGVEMSVRKGLFADSIRSIGEGLGYTVDMTVRKNTEADFKYINCDGAPDSFGVSVVHSSNLLYEPSFQNSNGVLFRAAQLEDVVGSKLLMLTRASRRGDKRYSDLFDAYSASLADGLNLEMVRKAFIYAAVRAGAKINEPYLLKKALEWYHPEKIKEGIAEKTGYQLDPQTVTKGIIKVFGELTRLTKIEKNYVNGKIPDTSASPEQYLTEGISCKLRSS